MGSARSSDTDPAGTSRAAAASAFTADQRSGAYPAGIGAHYWHLTRNRVVLGALRTAGAAAPVLDIGCGPGTTVRYLRERGLDCTGADLAHYEATDPDLARAVRYGQDVFALPAAERDRVRTLLLLDVLEHLPEPSAFLRRCVEAFPRVGHLVITLPARQELWSNFDAHYGHVRRYDRPSATALCRDAHLDVRRCDYFFHALYPAIALQRLVAVARTVEFAAVRHRRWHRLLAALLYRDAVWVPGAVPGSSLLLVTRPRP